MQLGESFFAHRFLAAPPGGDRGERKLFAAQTLADARQKAEQARRFEYARAKRIGDQHASGTRRAEQAGHAERGFAAQFERIAEIVVDAAQRSHARA